MSQDMYLISVLFFFTGHFAPPDLVILRVFVFFLLRFPPAHTDDDSFKYSTMDVYQVQTIHKLQ